MGVVVVTLFTTKLVAEKHENKLILETWANAQRDSRPAEYRWRPLFNTAVWLTPTTRVPYTVTMPRRETR